MYAVNSPVWTADVDVAGLDYAAETGFTSGSTPIMVSGTTTRPEALTADVILKARLYDFARPGDPGLSNPGRLTTQLYWTEEMGGVPWYEDITAWDVVSFGLSVVGLYYTYQAYMAAKHWLDRLLMMAYRAVIGAVDNPYAKAAMDAAGFGGTEVTDWRGFDTGGFGGGPHW